MPGRRPLLPQLVQLLQFLLLLASASFAGDAAPDAGMATAPASPPPLARVSVKISQVRVKGSLWVTLHSSAATFPGKREQAFRRLDVRPAQETVAVQFDDVPEGTYAVAVVHDENDNGKLDTWVFGIPAEGVGTSNNPRTMGPPSFEQASFSVGTAPVVLRIQMSY